MPISLHAAVAAAHAAQAQAPGNQTVGMLAFVGFFAFWGFVFWRPGRNRQR